MLRALIALLLSGGLTLGAAYGQTKLTFATDWKAQAEHGGFYQAIARGFYADADLDVRLRPGGPQTDVPRLMAAGAVDVAMASNSFQPYNLMAAGADVRVVMASFQKDPQVLMVHGDDPASGFADLKGRPIFIADSAIATFWPWLKSRFGYEDRQIRKYTYSLAPWLVNKGSVQEGYLTSEPFTARQAGAAPKVFLFADAGYTGYAAMVMTRADYLAKHRDVVRRFVEASVRGWRDYLTGDPAPGNALILEDNPEMTPALIAYSIGEMTARSIVGAPEAIGCMQADRWQQFEGEMQALGLISSDVSARDFVDYSLVSGCPKGP